MSLTYQYNLMIIILEQKEHHSHCTKRVGRILELNPKKFQEPLQWLKKSLWLRSYLAAVLLPISAYSFMSPQLETHDGSNQINDHGDKQEDDGGRLTSLCSAERPVDAVVKNRIWAESSTGCVAHIYDACQRKSMYAMDDQIWGEKTADGNIVINIFDYSFGLAALYLRWGRLKTQFYIHVPWKQSVCAILCAIWNSRNTLSYLWEYQLRRPSSKMSSNQLSHTHTYIYI